MIHIILRVQSICTYIHNTVLYLFFLFAQVSLCDAHSLRLDSNSTHKNLRNSFGNFFFLNSKRSLISQVNVIYLILMHSETCICEIYFFLTVEGLNVTRRDATWRSVVSFLRCYLLGVDHTSQSSRLSIRLVCQCVIRARIDGSKSDDTHYTMIHDPYVTSWVLRNLRDVFSIFIFVININFAINDFKRS